MTQPTATTKVAAEPIPLPLTGEHRGSRAETDAPRPPSRTSGLDAAVLKALTDVGYETPSAIQAATIPPLLAGRDVVGLAQTGTGKTAAFALPILSRLDVTSEVAAGAGPRADP